MSVKFVPGLTARLTLLFAAVSTAAILALGYFVGNAVEQHFVEQDMEVLSGKLEQTRNALKRAVREGTEDLLPEAMDAALVGHRGLAIAVVASDGQILFATRDVEFPHALLSQPRQLDVSKPMVWRSAQNNPFRGVVVQDLISTRLPGQVTIAVATDISHHEQFMTGFRRSLWMFVAVTACLAGFLGYLAVRRGLAPLRMMRQRAEEITARRLDARLDISAIPVELIELAQSLNAMLARLEDAFRRLADFSSDLAHEFRSPISNLLTQTQVTLSRPRSVEEYRDVLVSNVEEYERLSRMIADMLLLAQADEGQLVPAQQRLDLVPVIGSLLEFYELAAEERGVTLSLTGQGEIAGDPLMIRRAIGNLLSNAIRHSESGKTVSVSVGHERGDVVIEVSNWGAAIAAESLPRLFDRFYRADPSRSGHGGQTGLGLAIVKSIVEAHGGTISVMSHDGRTRFVMTIPSSVDKLAAT